MEQARLEDLLMRLKDLHLKGVEVDLLGVKVEKVETETRFMSLAERQAERVGTHF